MKNGKHNVRIAFKHISHYIEADKSFGLTIYHSQQNLHKKQNNINTSSTVLSEIVTNFTNQ